MGNPDAGSSAYQQAQEYELQPQGYQYEATNELQPVAIRDENTAPTYEPSYYTEQTQANDPQAQQQAQPPPPPVSQQQQPTPFPPPQASQAYMSQPPRPAIVPDPMQQNNQTYPNGPSQPTAYPPQGQQTIPAQPVKFPSPSPQAVPFPPPNQEMNPVYSHATVQTTPMMYPQATVQMPPKVGYQAPPAMQYQNNGPQPQYGIPLPSPGPKPINAWSSGLFDCMNDPMNALITACFPCLTFGQLAEIVDDGHTSCGTSGLLYGGVAFCIGMPCILSCTYRTKLRNKFSLPEAPAPDWVTHFFCEWCALCQEYRELQSRGWDPSIGWQGNLARNQNMHLQQATMMAPVNQRMMG